MGITSSTAGLKVLGKRKRKVEEDVEVLAEKARLARQDKCMKEINELLEKNRCNLQTVLLIADQPILLSNVLTFRSVIQVISR